MSDKTAQTTHSIHPILAGRWSPRAFDAAGVEPEKMLHLFESARWSPSASNEQPWRFIIGFKGDSSYQKILSTLVEFNQLWAHTAVVLLLAVANTESIKNPGKENPYALYDLGQAVAHLSFQAAAEGLFVHQMGGFDTEKAAELFGVPAEFRVFTAIAIGYQGDPEMLHPNLKPMEYAKRNRQALSEMLFSEKFGQTPSWLQNE